MEMVVKIVELLAPARDMAALNAAIKNGADSIYVGVEGYNMRANAANFAVDDLKETVKRCHDNDVKLYVCTNTIMDDNQIEDLKNLMPTFYSCGVDAVIASDLGALNIAVENDLDVHMSVQANISNLESLKVLEKLGVKRAVLSRELSLSQIQNMAGNTNLEVEVFVHGAMCVAVSGRCFLSSYLYDKSANCGECLQPCRKEWKLVSEDGEDFKLAKLDIADEVSDVNIVDSKNTVGSKKDKTHILSPKDLCMVENIPELIESGIDAFKIEGRARPADYVATVTGVYREAINTYMSGSWELNKRERTEKWFKELRKVFNRGFDTGFYFKTPNETSKYNQSTHIKKDIGAVVNYYSKVSAAEIRLWEDLECGDEIIIQGPTTGSFIQKVESMQLDGKNIQKGFKGHNVAISVRDKVRPNDSIYKRVKR
jgi:U32 family peptidase